MILGIDLGGTNLCLGIVEDGVVKERISVPSFLPEATLEETLEYLAGQIGKVMTPEIEKIGIGVPTVVDVKRGVVYDAANIPSWKEVHLKAYLEKRFSLPVNINNDANCYAMGAYGFFPQDDRPEVLVAVTLGTGMGVGVVDNGRLICGVNCGVGELGYLGYNGGILEEFCSKQFFAKYGKDSHETAIAAQEGDAEAIGLFNEFGRHLGYAVSIFMYAYDPSHIVFGGGIANAFPLFKDSLMEYLRENFPFCKNVENLVIDIQTSIDTPILGASLI